MALDSSNSLFPSCKPSLHCQSLPSILLSPLPPLFQSDLFSQPGCCYLWDCDCHIFCSRSPFLWLRLLPLLLPPSGCSPFTKQRKPLVYLMPSSLSGAFPHSAVTTFSAFTSLLPFLYRFCVLLLLADAWRHLLLSVTLPYRHVFPTHLGNPLLILPDSHS